MSLIQNGETPKDLVKKGYFWDFKKAQREHILSLLDTYSHVIVRIISLELFKQNGHIMSCDITDFTIICYISQIEKNISQKAQDLSDVSSKLSYSEPAHVSGKYNNDHLID